MECENVITQTEQPGASWSGFNALVSSGLSC